MLTDRELMKRIRAIDRTLEPDPFMITSLQGELNRKVGNASDEATKELWAPYAAILQKAQLTVQINTSLPLEESPIMDLVVRKNREDYSFVSQITPFSGNYADWKLFKAIVDKEIITANDISATMKASILSRLLTGDAFPVWRNLSPDSKSVEECWKLLGEHYESEVNIDNYLLGLIHDMKSVPNEYSVDELKALLAQLLSFKGLLNSLGSIYAGQTRNICAKIAEKFWSGEDKTVLLKCKTMEAMLKHVNKLIDNAVTLSVHKPKAKATQHRSSSKPDRAKHSKTTKRLNSRVSAVGNAKMCYFCSRKGHWTSDCRTEMDRKRKKELIEENQLCRKCLAPGHFSFQCHRKVFCVKCRAKHPSSMHVEENPQTSHIRASTPSLRSSSSSSEASLSSQEMASSDSEVSTNAIGPRNKCCRFIFSTLVNQRKTDILLDTGSGITIVSADRVRAEHRMPIKTLQVSGFASGMKTQIRHSTVLTVDTPHGSTKVKSYVSEELPPTTLIIGRDNLALFLTNHNQSLQTVWGSYNLSGKYWSSHETINAVDTWYEKEVEEEGEDDIDIEIRKVNEGRYEASLPFFSTARPRENYGKALARLKRQLPSLEAKGHYQEYNKQIQELKEHGFVEKVHRTSGHFINHRAVIREGAETTKFRVVLSPIELNYLLWKGETTGLDLLHHLLNFRSHPFVFTADLKKAFLQIQIKPEHRRYLRFLWQESGKIVAYQMTVLPFGVISAPAILTKVVRHIISNMTPTAQSHLKDSVYMDDLIVGAASEEILAKVLGETIKVFSKAGFETHKIVSNVLSLSNQEVVKDFTHRILGLNWNPQRDHLSISLSKHPYPVTRRQLLSSIGKLFDPFGFTDPLKLSLRKLYAELLPLDWDTPMNEEHRQFAARQLRDIYRLNQVSFDRHIGSQGILHCFADASGVGYGYCLYWNDHLLFGRSKLITNPRSVVHAELQALFELTRAISKLLPSLSSPTSIRLYSDSLINVARLRNSPNEYEIVVARRLLAIQRRMNQFKGTLFHVSGKFNPADHFSRPRVAQEIRQWTTIDLEQLEHSIGEPQSVKTVCSIQITPETPKTPDGLTRWLVTQPVSKQLLIIHGFKRWMSRAIKGKGTGTNTVRRTAMEMLAYVNQRDLTRLPPECEYRKDIVCLKSRLPYPQYYFPAQSFAARSMLSLAHQDSLHRGAIMSLALLHPQVYIPGASRKMKGLVKDCQRCSRTRGKAILQPQGLLHEIQVRPGQPFESISLDCFGPLFLANRVKHYGLVYVCRYSKAVKLILLESLQGQTLYKALLAEWEASGFPLNIRSDNGTNFTYVQKELQVSQVPELMNIQWKYSTPLSPWMNGVAEKMVHVTKGCLRQFSRKCKSFIELQRRFKTIERIANSRPVLYTDDKVVSAFELAYGRPLILPSETQPLDAPVVLLSERNRQRKEMLLLWKSQYLKRASKFSSGKIHTISINDVFLVPDTMRQRLVWPTGRVCAKKDGSDGVTRTVQLVMADGSRLWRPAQGLIPLTPGRGETEKATDGRPIPPPSGQTPN